MKNTVKLIWKLLWIALAVAGGVVFFWLFPLKLFARLAARFGKSSPCPAALSSVVAAVFRTTLKLVIGLMTGSLGILAEAAHVDVSRSRVLHRAARKHDSQALEADALRFSTDIYSSAVVKEVPDLDGYSRLHIRPGPGGYDVVLHCLADPDLPVVEAHRLADQVEKLLHVRIPGIKKLLVHVTPEGEMGPPAQPGGDKWS